MFEADRATWGIADPDFGGEDLPANKTTLGHVIEDTGKKTINYIYDFGDSWEHKIRIGRITDPVPGGLYPRLTEVTGKCPPEDVGGFPGYYGFLDAMADPKHPEHDHLKDWYGDAFDPNQPETTNSNSKSSVSQNAGSPENQGNKAVRPDAYARSAGLPVGRVEAGSRGLAGLAVERLAIGVVSRRHRGLMEDGHCAVGVVAWIRQ